MFNWNVKSVFKVLETQSLNRRKLKDFRFFNIPKI